MPPASCPRRPTRAIEGARLRVGDEARPKPSRPARRPSLTRVAQTRASPRPWGSSPAETQCLREDSAGPAPTWQAGRPFTGHLAGGSSCFPASEIAPVHRQVRCEAKTHLVSIDPFACPGALRPRTALGASALTSELDFLVHADLLAPEEAGCPPAGPRVPAGETLVALSLSANASQIHHNFFKFGAQQAHNSLDADVGSWPIPHPKIPAEVMPGRPTPPTSPIKGGQGGVSYGIECPRQQVCASHVRRQTNRLNHCYLDATPGGEGEFATGCSSTGWY
jgi:hypothetical protein